MRILFVEDDEIATQIGQNMLRLFPDIQVEHQATGYGALETFAPDKFDLLIVDLGLPDISGAEIAQMIKQKYDSCPPVVAVTAHVNPNDTCPPGIERIYAKPLTYELIKEILSCFS